MIFYVYLRHSSAAATGQDFSGCDKNEELAKEEVVI
jgi:hypothetical protein